MVLCLAKAPLFFIVLLLPDVARCWGSDFTSSSLLGLRELAKGNCSVRSIPRGVLATEYGLS